MAGNYSNQDSFDIKELATLNEDISVDFLEQLQNQVAQSASEFKGESSDGDLFEEVTPQQEMPAVNQNEDSAIIQNAETLSKPINNKEKQIETNAPKTNIDDSLDDNFIKKYKAKLNKQKGVENIESEPAPTTENNVNIEDLTAGNIIEKPIVQEQINYNDSLDYLDENIKYSKYVIYIDPENTEFIESLTVKERKNLINKILREQDDIAITKKRFNMFQSILKHSIIAIITIAISIPVIYYTINASLEASINNYRNSQSIFKTLYKEKGKIQTTTKFR